jgi:4-hydroxy-4-methyl-2-oxoglutarate aldolase
MDDPSLIRRLLSLDSCAVSDALDALGLPSALSGIAPRTGPARIAGRVKTVKLGLADPSVKSTRHLCTAAIETASPGDIIVVEQATGVEAAGWGGVLSNAAKMRGVAGVIVEGPVRDIDEAFGLGFPLFARSTTPRTARGRIQEVACSGPVSVGGVIVNEGDYVVADSSGISFIAATEVGRILASAERIVAREVAMTKDVCAGQPVGTVMGSSYEDLLQSTP